MFKSLHELQDINLLFVKLGIIGEHVRSRSKSDVYSTAH